MRFEILAGLPGTGPMPTQFSATGQGTHREGFVVRFHPESGASWVGNFQCAFGSCHGVFEHPNGSFVVVVAAGLAYVVDPAARQLVSHFGADLSGVLGVPELPALIFASSTDFEALGATGTLWRSRRVSWDGMRNLSLDGLLLHGEAWEYTDRWYPFTVDLRSGEVMGGSYDLTPRATPARWWRRLLGRA